MTDKYKRITDYANSFTYAENQPMFVTLSPNDYLFIKDLLYVNDFLFIDGKGFHFRVDLTAKDL